MREAEDQLMAAFAPICATVGLSLVDVELRANTLLVTVEGEGPLDLDAVATASRAISDLLDVRADLAPEGRYDLEVSSPGLERRLRRPEHFTRALGSSIALRLVAGAPAPRRLAGTLSAVEGEEVVVDLGDGASRRLPIAEIDRAHTVFNWRAALAESRRDAAAEPTARESAGSRKAAHR